MFTTKLGTNKGLERSRIWIEGQRLIDAGFVRGSNYTRIWDGDKRVLSLQYVDAHTGTTEASDRIYTVSGKADHPIIDITGKRVCEMFGKHTHVEVAYAEGWITIKGAA